MNSSNDAPYSTTESEDNGDLRQIKGTLTVNESSKIGRERALDFIDLDAQQRFKSVRLADVQEILAPLLSGEAGPDYTKQVAFPKFTAIARRYSFASVAGEIRDVVMRLPGAVGDPCAALRRRAFDMAAAFFAQALRELEAIPESQRPHQAEAPKILNDLLTCYFLSGRGIEGIEYCLGAVERMLEVGLVGAVASYPDRCVIEKATAGFVDTVLLENELHSNSLGGRTARRKPPVVEVKTISFLISWRDGVLRCLRNMSTVGLSVSLTPESVTKANHYAIEQIERLVASGETASAVGCPSISGICFELALESALKHDAEEIASTCRRNAIWQFESAAKMQMAAGLPGRARTTRERAKKLEGLPRPAKPSATHRSTKATETT